MSVIGLHPEEALDRFRRGQLGRAERAELLEHLAACPACAAQVQLERDLTAVLDSTDRRDTERARRLAAAVIRTGPADTRRRRAIGPISVGWAAVLAVSMLGTGVAAGTLWQPARALVARIVAPTAPPEPPPRMPRPNRVRRAPEPAPAVVEPPTLAVTPPEPPAVPRPVVSPRPRPIARIEPAPAVEPPPEPPPVEAAPEPPPGPALFRALASARASGDLDETLRLARALDEAAPGSRESLAAQVAAGRLALERGHRAGEALAAFERYLGRAPSGSLAEEARVGRATALERLGRAQEARSAWRELLARHPQSLHAEQARARLGGAP